MKSDRVSVQCFPVAARSTFSMLLRFKSIIIPPRFQLVAIGRCGRHRRNGVAGLIAHLWNCSLTICKQTQLHFWNTCRIFSNAVFSLLSQCHTHMHQGQVEFLTSIRIYRFLKDSFLTLSSNGFLLFFKISHIRHEDHTMVRQIYDVTVIRQLRGDDVRYAVPTGADIWISEAVETLIPIKMCVCLIRNQERSLSYTGRYETTSNHEAAIKLDMPSVPQCCQWRKGIGGFYSLWSDSDWLPPGCQYENCLNL